MTPLHTALICVCLVAAAACDPSASDGDKQPVSEDSDVGPVDSGEGPGTHWYLDDDQDGYGATTDEGVVSVEPPEDHVDNNLDCDDTKTTVSPDAQEICNGRDDDCDGLTDGSDALDAERWYADEDGDGFGDPDNDVFDCELGEGYTDDNTDCDDTNSEVYPEQTESCNGIDDDCDGDVDDDSDERVVGYRDEDADGYGNENDRFETTGCGDLPEGYVDNYLDCDDSALLVNPDATEVCGDEVDENCDQTPSDCEFWGRHGMHEADATFWESGTSEGVGGGVAAQDVDGDGDFELWIGAFESTVDGVKSGHAFLVDGNADGTIDLTMAAIGEVHGASADAWLGENIQDAGDVDGDGFPDIWLGAPMDSSATVTYAGSATLMLGPVVGSIDVADAEQRWFGEGSGERVGATHGGGGDLDGDGTPDALIGAFFRNTGSGFSGSVFVVYQDGVGGERNVTDAAIEIYGDMADDTLGRTAEIVGDSNGDGWSDLLLGAADADISAEDSGAVYVIDDLPGDGVYAVSELTDPIGGESTQSFAGGEGAALGDLNGDGYADVGVGASYDGETHAGAVYVIYGPVAGRTSLADADAKFCGVEDYEYTSRVEGGQDLDGDGSGDLLIGAENRGWSERLGGKVYLVRGPLDGGVSSLEASDAVFYGTTRDNAVGEFIAMVPDANGDGYSDALVGARGVRFSETENGAAYLILGQPF